MIYALTSLSIPGNTRKDIARAILAHQDVSRFVQQSDIVHVADAGEGQVYYCIYCRDTVHPSRGNPPRGLHAADHWYFMHNIKDDCLGTDLGLGLGLTNPRSQGCYVQLGCEFDANGQPTEWHRVHCQTIENGRSYCHLAQTERCLDVRLLL